MVGPTKSPQTSLGLHQRVDSVLKLLRLVRKGRGGRGTYKWQAVGTLSGRI